jgi:hypothetical protein
MQQHLGAVVKPHQRAFLPLTFSRFDGQITQFGAVELSC